MSKLPAKTPKTSPPAARTAAKPVSRLAVKPAAKPASKLAAQPLVKTPAKPSAKTSPSAAKPAAKAAPKPVAKAAPPKSAAAATPPAKAPVKTPVAVPEKPAPKTADKAVAQTATVVKATPTKTSAAAAAPAAPAPKPAGKAAKAAAPSRSGVVKPGPTPANAPPPAPTPAGIRFMDRFAPPKHVKSPEPIEVQKTTHKADPKLANAWKTKPGREMSEPELLAMPDGEYMNDKQMDFFRLRLQQQKDDLLANAEDTTEHLREDTSIVPDPADRATIEEEHALELRTRDRERKLLKKIAQSLSRLDSGDYGFCDETGEPIGLARLLARPTATLSLEAQQRRELKQKMFG